MEDEATIYKLSTQHITKVSTMHYWSFGNQMNRYIKLGD
jgi:hypothetical protein